MKFRRAYLTRPSVWPFSLAGGPGRSDVVEIVRLQSQEFSRRRLAPLADDPRDGDLGIVVADPRWARRRKLERSDMPRLERLGAFPGKRLAEERVAVRQRHHAEHDLDRAATIHGLRLPKSNCASPGGCASGMNTSACRLPVTPDLIANDGDPAGVALLVTQTIEDPLARMTLLPVDLLVGLQDLVNDRHERPDHRLVPLGLLRCLGGSFVPQDLLDRPEIQIVLLGGLTPAHARRPTRRDESSSTCPCL